MVINGGLTVVDSLLCLKTDISAWQTCIWKQSMLTHIDNLKGSPRVSFMTELQGALFNCSETPLFICWVLVTFPLELCESWGLNMHVKLGSPLWVLPATFYHQLPRVCKGQPKPSFKIRTKSHLTMSGCETGRGQWAPSASLSPSW